MTPAELLRIRLYNQQLTTCRFTRPHEVVAWLGAMQSQNYEMAKWGIGARLPGFTNKQIEAAINDAAIVRTHIMRPTWHFVAAEDIHWLIDLTAQRLKPAFTSYARSRGFTEQFIIKGHQAVHKILDTHGHLTRQEIGEHLKDQGFKITDDNVVNFIVSRGELEGMVCNGVVRGNKQTYALLHQRVPKTFTLSREEALERLARKYFASHGPATADDFIWWSGLTKTEACKGIELAKHHFISEEINGQTYWMPSDIQTPPPGSHQLHLLPAFDEYVVSYKNRSEIIDEKWYRKVLTINGIFSPTIHLDGRIIGSWKRVVKKNGVDAELTFLEKTPKKVQVMYGKVVQAYRDFNAG